MEALCVILLSVVLFDGTRAGRCILEIPVCLFVCIEI